MILYALYGALAVGYALGFVWVMLMLADDNTTSIWKALMFAALWPLTLFVAAMME